MAIAVVYGCVVWHDCSRVRLVSTTNGVSSTLVQGPVTTLDGAGASYDIFGRLTQMSMHGSTTWRTVTTTSGTTGTQERYHAYGATRSGGITATDYQYTGQFNDNMSGLVYMHARYYDPHTGQFLSPDTIVPSPNNLFDYNRYMYGYGNPVKYSDPSGHVPEVADDSGGNDYQISLWGVLARTDPSRLQGEMLAWMLDHQDLNQILMMQRGLARYFGDQAIVSSTFDGVFTNSAAGGSLPGLYESDQWPAVAYLLGATFGAAGVTDAKYDDPIGSPIWSKGPPNNSVLNAYDHWKKHGADFPELQNSLQYVRAAHQFISNLPPGTLTHTRANGQTLYYNPATNVFAASLADGTPKTMFVPADGMTYFLKQTGGR